MKQTSTSLCRPREQTQPNAQEKRWWLTIFVYRLQLLMNVFTYIYIYMYLQNINKITNYALTVNYFCIEFRNPMNSTHKTSGLLDLKMKESRLTNISFYIENYYFWAQQGERTGCSDCCFSMLLDKWNLLSNFKALNLYHHTQLLTDLPSVQSWSGECLNFS